MGEGKYEEADKIISAKTKGEEAEETLYPMYSMMAASIAAVKEGGYVNIDASSDNWYTEMSRKVISALAVKNFKMPFGSGVISIDTGKYLFFSDEKGIAITMLWDTILFGPDKKEMSRRIETIDMDEVAGLVEDSVSFAFVIMKNEDGTIGESMEQQFFDENIEDRQKKTVYAILSALMYVSMSNSSVEEFSDTVKRKKVLHKKRKGVPKHVMNVINVRQKVRKSTGVAISDSTPSDKMWIVRGHWRNQWYAKDGVHKPKWIDPHFKGKGKEFAEKIYKV